MTYYNVGKIVNTQGLQGELRVLSVTDFADERFKKKSLLALFDDKDNYIMDVEVASHRNTRTLILLSLRDSIISMMSKSTRGTASKLLRKI